MKRTLSLILAMLMIFSLFTGLSISAAEDDKSAETGVKVIEVSDMTEFISYMESDGNFNLKLTKNLRSEVKQKGNEIDGFQDLPYYITVGTGKKTVDLNGWGIMSTLKNYHETRSAMFNIQEGSEVIIDDSSGTDKGEIFYDGFIPEFEQYRPSKMNLDTMNQNRDIFSVNGGSLTINGGSIIAGRMKEERYYGHYFNKIMNGTAVELNSGRVVINGGKLTGRGMHEVPFWPRVSIDDIDDAVESGKIKDSVQCYMDRNAVVEAHSGTLIVNSGVFYAKSSADVFQIDDPYYDDNEQPTHAEIKSAKYYRHKNEKDTNFLRCYSVDIVAGMYRPSSYGYIGTPYSCYDQDRVTFKTEGNWTNVLPVKKHDLFTIVKGGSDGQQTKGDICYTGEEDKTLCIPTDCLWDSEFTRHTGTSDPGHYAKLWAYVYRDDPGVDSKITIGSGTVISQGAVKPNEDPLVSKYLTARPDTEPQFNIPLSDLVPDDYKLGDDLTVYLVQTDEFFSSSGALVDYYCSSRIVHIIYPKETVTVLTQPQSFAVTQNTPVTFLSSASGNPSDSWWEEVSPVEGKRHDATSFDGTVSKLDWSGESTITVRACFKGKYGTVKSDPATVSIKPPAGAEDQYVTFYTGAITGSITPRDPVYNTGYSELNWQEYNSVLHGWTYMNNTDHINCSYYLTFDHPWQGDAGKYRMKLTYPDGTTWTSETIHVTVKSGSPPNYIEDIEIFGLGDLYTGEKPATASDLWTNDPRYDIESITWGNLTGGSTGVLTTNSYFTIKLSSKAIQDDGHSYYWFHWDENKEIPFTVHGNNRTVRGICYMSGTNELNRAATFSYYFNNYTYLYPANDSVKLAKTSFDLMTGMDVNITLSPTIICPDRHEKQHSISGAFIYSGTLPKGLTMDEFGHITGTLTEEPSDKSIVVTLKYYGDLYNDCYSDITFNIYEAAAGGGSADLKDLDGAFHTHTFGEWGTDGTSLHSHVCTSCGCKESAPHNWSDDYEVIKEATPEKNGTLRYTCEDCGAQKTVSYVYEPETGKLGDTDNDGNVTISDATVIQFRLASLPNQTFNESAADTDEDGNISIIDVTYIQKWLAGLPSNDNIGKPIG